MAEKWHLATLTSLLLLTTSNCFSATELRDEGTSQGYINVVDCVGAGVSCSKSGIVGTLTIPGGGAATAAGTDRDIQFNDGGTNLGADRVLQWYKTPNLLVISRDSGQTTQPAIMISSDSGASLASISHDGSASFSSLTLGTALTAPNGGTGNNTYALGDLLQGNGSGTLSKVTIGSMGQLLSADTTVGFKWVTGVISSDVQSGVFPEAKGGTGQSTYTKGDLLASNGTNTLGKLGIGSMGQILSVDTASAQGLKWVTGVVSSDVNAGVFPYLRGGTGYSSYMLGDLLQGNGTSLSKLAIGSMGQILSSDTVAGTKWVTGIVSSDVQSGVFSTARGGTGQSSDTKGDLLVGTGSGWNKVVVGSMGQILSVDTGTTTGVKWVASPSGASPLTTKGDIYVYSSSNDRLPVGSMGQILSVDTGAPNGLAWVNSPTGGSGTVNSGTINQFAYYTGSTEVSSATLISTDGTRLSIGPSTSSKISMDVSGSFRTNPITLVDAPNITPDAAASNFFIVTLTGQPRNLNNPLNGVIGQKIVILISQDSTGSRKIGFGNNYAFGSTVTTYDASTTAGMHDLVGLIMGPVSWDVAAVSLGYR